MTADAERVDPVPTTTRQSEPEARWIVPLLVLAGLFVTLAAVRSAFVGIPLKDPHHSMFGSRFGVFLLLLVLLAVLDAWWRLPRGGRSPRAVLAGLQRKWTWRRTALSLVALLSYQVVYFSYHNLKSWDVFNAPRDSILLHWDKVIFFGHSPAVLLHDLFGQHVAAWVLWAIYEAFGIPETVGPVAAIVFVERLRDGFVFIAAGMWVWILGVGSYYLIPTLGPFWSAPKDFAGLAHTPIQDDQAHLLVQRAHLLAHPHAADSWAAVSAFASLHIGVTALVLLMASYYRLRRTTIVMLVFLIGTAFATVYWGWHFAVDDVAGLIIAFLGVRFGRWMIYPKGEAAAAPSVAGPPRHLVDEPARLVSPEALPS
ncbi:phosphatase PAP2 family protein [Nocardioides terrisoli]|uniref:phosphatase PAP2 family protein n=1 Tax=Nocardioides terrisoli TaxID=3388267 RepID=UPI00287BA25C|nr:phosphatase PAP2 family protein [Nocardioides marmorisolisilvae]